MKMCSLFDGSGGFPLAGVLCGIEPVMASEVEPYPIAVTRSRFPDMYHIGDVSKVNGAEIEPVDLITFGSPCQDLSVAGKRAGLKHEENGDEETTRSGLFMEAIRIIKEMREATDGKYPTFALWENVPGAFSSNKGEDFRTVLEEFIKIKEPAAKVPEVSKNGWPYADIYVGDGWSVAYRTFDAQFWGVPQRRRRIYLVADFRGERAGKILFEREGLRGYPPKSREERQRASSDAENGPGTADPEAESHLTPETPQNDNLSPTDGHILDDQGGQQISVRTDGKSPTLRAETHGNLPCVMEAYGVTTKGNGDAFINPEKHTALATGGGQAGQGYPCVMQSAGFKPSQGAKAQGMGYAEEQAPTLLAGQEPGVCIAFEPGVASRCGGHVYEDISGTLRANPGDNQMTAVYSIENHPNDSRVKIDEEGKVQALTGRMGTGGGNVPMVMEPVVFDGANITSPENGANPKPGDPCHTLSTDSRNILVEPKQEIIGSDLYNLKTTGDKAVSLTTNANATGAGPTVVVPIHDQATRFSGKHGNKQDGKGNGLGVGAEGDPMYTLTGGDHHAICLETFHCTTEEDKTQPLKARDYKDPLVIGIDRAAFNQGQNAKYDFSITEDQSATLVARGPNAVCYWDGGQKTGTLTANNAGGTQRMPDKENFNCVIQEEAETQYIVRRLTPTECCRLQGFPDGWGEINPKEDFTDEEYKFWYEVRNTHAAINGKKQQVYTKPQMLTWYNKLHTDSAEYKMWGNGISLPTALYVMQGIADALEEQEREEK